MRIIRDSRERGEKNMPVPPKSQHIDSSRGDPMAEDRKYDATYKIGKTTVHVVAPPPMSEEKRERILNEYHYAGWAIWNSLSDEEKLRINEEEEKR